MVDSTASIMSTVVTAFLLSLLLPPTLAVTPAPAPTVIYNSFSEFSVWLGTVASEVKAAASFEPSITPPFTEISGVTFTPARANGAMIVAYGFDKTVGYDMAQFHNLPAMHVDQCAPGGCGFFPLITSGLLYCERNDRASACCPLTARDLDLHVQFMALKPGTMYTADLLFYMGNCGDKLLDVVFNNSLLIADQLLDRTGSAPTVVSYTWTQVSGSTMEFQIAGSVKHGTMTIHPTYDANPSIVGAILRSGDGNSTSTPAPDTPQPPTPSTTTSLTTSSTTASSSTSTAVTTATPRPPSSSTAKLSGTSTAAGSPFLAGTGNSLQSPDASSSQTLLLAGMLGGGGCCLLLTTGAFCVFLVRRRRSKRRPAAARHGSLAIASVKTGAGSRGGSRRASVKILVARERHSSMHASRQSVKVGAPTYGALQLRAAGPVRSNQPAEAIHQQYDRVELPGGSAARYEGFSAPLPTQQPQQYDSLAAPLSPTVSDQYVTHKLTVDDHYDRVGPAALIPDQYAHYSLSSDANTSGASTRGNYDRIGPDGI